VHADEKLTAFVIRHPISDQKITAPHTDRYERRLFPPEQSLANDKIDRPTIYLFGNEATKFRDQPSRFTM
jgi:hypothetical protein